MRITTWASGPGRRYTLSLKQLSKPGWVVSQTLASPGQGNDFLDEALPGRFGPASCVRAIGEESLVFRRLLEAGLEGIPARRIVPADELHDVGPGVFLRRW
jgi:hypothetical protein